MCVNLIGFGFFIQILLVVLEIDHFLVSKDGGNLDEN